jgi:hypothetical protein
MSNLTETYQTRPTPWGYEWVTRGTPKYHSVAIYADNSAKVCVIQGDHAVGLAQRIVDAVNNETRKENEDGR